MLIQCEKNYFNATIEWNHFYKVRQNNLNYLNRKQKTQIRLWIFQHKIRRKLWEFRESIEKCSLLRGKKIVQNVHEWITKNNNSANLRNIIAFKAIRIISLEKLLNTTVRCRALIYIQFRIFEAKNIDGDYTA